MVRNALIAAGNSKAADLVRLVVALLDDPAPVIRGTAVWALGRLDPKRLADERPNRIAAEIDDAVLAEWGTGPMALGGRILPLP
jgi:epoxyqueuosine reductase